MIHSPPRDEGLQTPSLYIAITGWASHAKPRLLGGIAAAGILAQAVLLVVDWHRAPIAGLLLTASAVAGWGMLEQRATTPHSFLVSLTQGLLVVLGTISSIIGGFALLFWVMGPAPVL